MAGNGMDRIGMDEKTKDWEIQNKFDLQFVGSFN